MFGHKFSKKEAQKLWCTFPRAAWSLILAAASIFLKINVYQDVQDVLLALTQ